MSTLPSRRQFKEATDSPIIPVGRSLHRFAIGVDPGDHTGFAVFDRQEKKLVEVLTLDFWRTYWHVVNSYQPGDCRIYIEFTKHLKIHKRHYAAAKAVEQRSGKGGRGTLMKIIRDAGGVIRESELLIQGLRLAGYHVEEAGVADKNTWTEGFFKQVTKWQPTVSQHARDAVCLCWMR